LPEKAGERTGDRDEAVGEVLVHAEGFANAELLHEHEARAVHEAVVLVLVPLEVLEGGGLFVFGHVVQLPESSREQLLSHAHGQVVAHLRVRVPLRLQQCDRLGHDVVGGQEDVGELTTLVLIEDLAHLLVLLVALHEEREEEARVQKDQSDWSP
jgi:hypothetical protein